MQKPARTLLGALMITLVMVDTAVAGPLEDADAAERRDDHATAVPIYRSLAEKGNVAAQKRLGFFYYVGWGVKRDWLEAAKWYSKALEAGDEDAGGTLSHIGRNWRFMNPDGMNPIIYELVEKAAKKGNATAQYSLGVMNYPLGDSSFDENQGNLHEALIWYRRAAEQGDVDAQVSLGLACADGIGVPQNYIEAHKWYNLAASRVKYTDMRTDFIKRRDALARKMTPEQIAEAQKLASEWKPKPER
jgi:TPR repeat protein